MFSVKLGSLPGFGVEMLSPCLIVGGIYKFQIFLEKLVAVLLHLPRHVSLSSVRPSDPGTLFNCPVKQLLFDYHKFV